MKDLKMFDLHVIEYCECEEAFTTATLLRWLCLTTECTFRQAVYASSRTLKAHFVGRGLFKQTESCRLPISMNWFFLHSA